jgi:hypothetical protein
VPKFRHTYPYSRTFIDLGFSVEPGEVVERDENPDPNFFEEVVPVVKSTKAEAKPDAEPSEEN